MPTAHDRQAAAALARVISAQFPHISDPTAVNLGTSLVDAINRAREGGYDLGEATLRIQGAKKSVLGSVLKRYREQAGLTQEQVARVLECTGAKITRIETGAVGVRWLDLKEMLRLYRVTNRQAFEEVERLYREDRAKRSPRRPSGRSGRAA